MPQLSEIEILGKYTRYVNSGVRRADKERTLLYIYSHFIYLFITYGGFSPQNSRSTLNMFEKARVKAIEFLRENPGDKLGFILVSYLRLCENIEYRNDLIMESINRYTQLSNL